MIELSIIICTINRTIELDNLLNSLIYALDNIENEILIIDQNTDSNFIDNTIKKYDKCLNIKHFKVNFKGLSKAKNFGIKNANGKLLSFPDDDCKIFNDTYKFAIDFFNNNNTDILFGKCIDSFDADSVLKFKSSPYYLNKKNMVGGFVEATGIIKSTIFESNFFFDENMGAGCFHGAEEGYDWVYRILHNSNFKIYYTPLLRFYHPQVLSDKGSKKSLLRAFTYRCGTAYLCKKHKFYYLYFKRLFICIFGIFFYLIFKIRYSKFYISEFCGLIMGVIV